MNCRFRMFFILLATIVPLALLFVFFLVTPSDDVSTAECFPGYASDMTPDEVSNLTQIPLLEFNSFREQIQINRVRPSVIYNIETPTCGLEITYRYDNSEFLVRIHDGSESYGVLDVPSEIINCTDYTNLEDTGFSSACAVLLQNRERTYYVVILTLDPAETTELLAADMTITNQEVGH